jgi:hypothetical protein
MDSAEVMDIGEVTAAMKVTDFAADTGAGALLLLAGSTAAVDSAVGIAADI